MLGRPSRRFSIAANTVKLEVDNRFPLKKYFRTADNVLKQAYIYREEKNLIELYILLLRFSSLVGETIPEHQDYGTLSAKDKTVYKQKFRQVLTELEKLKPEVQRQVDQLNNVFASGNSYEWPPISRSPTSLNINFNKGSGQVTVRQAIQTGNEDQRVNLAWRFPPPKEDTLSRHSLLGPTGLRARWDIPISQARVQYPSSIDATPVQIPRLDQNTNIESPLLASIFDLEVQSSFQSRPDDEPTDIASQLSLLLEPAPPPVAAPVQSVAAMSDLVDLSKAGDSPFQPSNLPSDPLSMQSDDVDHQISSPKSLHIPTKLMEEFLKLAHQNTKNSIETCGVLAGSFKNATFYVTALIVPKQQATANTCQTVNEEEIFEWQDKRGLFQLGWIHTHPTQSCFMSSVDLHTHYSYQVMLPEAIAIVMAPTDERRKYGIFRLSDPGGVKVIQKCPMRGFHAHDQPSNGSPIYESCSHVYMSTTLSYQVTDLR